MQYYYIASQWDWTKNPFVITVAGQPNVTITSFNPATGPTDDQLFQVEFNFDFNTPGIQFRSKSTGLYIARNTDKFDVLGTPKFQDDGQTWDNGSITPPESRIVFTWGAVNSGEWSTLRPLGRDDLNLNVKDGGTYTDGQQVIFYEWKGGYQNMQWKLIQAP